MIAIVLAENNAILEALVEGAREGLASDGLDPLLGLLLKLGVVGSSALLGELSIQSCVRSLEGSANLSIKRVHATCSRGQTRKRKRDDKIFDF